MAHLDNRLLIHVAAEAEQRGRVVLAVRSGAPQRVAIDAALAVAEAFDAWMDCLIVEEPNLFALTQHGFAREVSYAGRIAPLSLISVTDSQSIATDSARRALELAAKASKVRVVTSVVREAFVPALAQACVNHGPWNMVAFAEPLCAGDGHWLRDLLWDVSGTTGIILTGPRAAKLHGNVTVVVEDIERLPQMLRAAERWLLRKSAVDLSSISLLLVGAAADDDPELEGHVRLMLSDYQRATGPAVKIASAGIQYGTAPEMAEVLRQLDGGLVIARNGGLVVPSDGAIGMLMSVLTCPLLLVR